MSTILRTETARMTARELLDNKDIHNFCMAYDEHGEKSITVITTYDNNKAYLTSVINTISRVESITYSIYSNDETEILDMGIITIITGNVENAYSQIKTLINTV